MVERFNMSIDFDILNLIANSIPLIRRSPSIYWHTGYFVSFHAMDTISVDDFDCLSVYSLTETEQLRVSRSDEVRIYHQADLGRQLEEKASRPQKRA